MNGKSVIWVVIGWCLMGNSMSRAAGETISIGLIGDSTVAKTYGWGPAFAAQVQGKATVINAAVNGATLESLDKKKKSKLDVLIKKKPDYVLIQFGHNDMKKYDAKVYSAKLADYVKRIKAGGIKPVVLSSVTRRNFDENGKIKPRQSEKGHSLPEFAVAARAVAQKANVPFIDLNTISIAHHNKIGPKESATYNVEPNDTTHFSKKGAAAIAGLVLRELKAVVPALGKRLH